MVNMFQPYLAKTSSGAPESFRIRQAHWHRLGEANSPLNRGKTPWTKDQSLEFHKLSAWSFHLLSDLYCLFFLVVADPEEIQNLKHIAIGLWVKDPYTPGETAKKYGKSMFRPPKIWSGRFQLSPSRLVVPLHCLGILSIIYIHYIYILHYSISWYLLTWVLTVTI